MKVSKRTSLLTTLATHIPEDIRQGQAQAKVLSFYCCLCSSMLSLEVMMIVGLTGGLGAGKTTIAGLFQACGAKIIDADQLARHVVEEGKPCWREIKKQFGASVLYSDKRLNRQALAQIVFKNPRKLRILQNIIHPRVAREQAKRTRSINKTSPHAVIIYDAALLIEAEAHQRMDHVIVVKADRATQISRVCARDGVTKAEVLRRLSQQMPLRQKLAYADTVLDGTWSRPRLRAVVQSLYRSYQQEALHQSPKQSSNT
jgi:dephospho-CoA kinase